MTKNLLLVLLPSLLLAGDYSLSRKERRAFKSHFEVLQQSYQDREYSGFLTFSKKFLEDYEKVLVDPRDKVAPLKQEYLIILSWENPKTLADHQKNKPKI